MTNPLTDHYLSLMDLALESAVGIAISVSDIRSFRFNFYRTRNLSQVDRYSTLALFTPRGAAPAGTIWIKKTDATPSPSTPSGAPLDPILDIEDLSNE